LIAIILIYPSSFLEILSERYPFHTDDITKISDYMFWGGVYRSSEERKSINFILPLFTLLILLILEKLAQRWLTNRFGLTLFDIYVF
jgi:hypothetical protein